VTFSIRARNRNPFTIWPRSLLGHVALLLTLGTGLAVLLGVLLWAGLGKPDPAAPAPAPSASAAARPLTAAERLDSIKLVLATVGGVGAVVALTVAYRKQRHGEAAELAPTGHMTFHGATFVGSFLFNRLRLNGAPIWFTKATFAGESVTFDKAVLVGSTVNFGEATFAKGTVSFKDVQAPPAANFAGARHVGGTVDWGPFTPLPPPPVSGPASALTRLAKAIGSARSRRGGRPG
jgi:hypothetical protein